jgi:hypothetical protein
MDLINKLPVVLAAAAAFVVGAYGYANGHRSGGIYANMCLALICFYGVGYLVRYTVQKTGEEYREKTERAPEEDELVYSLDGGRRGAAGGGRGGEDGDGDGEGEGGGEAEGPGGGAGGGPPQGQAAGRPQGQDRGDDGQFTEGLPAEGGPRGDGDGTDA